MLTASTTATLSYSLDTTFSGSSFFDTFNFYNGSDPTHGFASYQSGPDAVANNLIGLVNSTSAMNFPTPNNTLPANAEGRASVRISSDKTWNQGLLIADVAHMPVGCGTWPALWLLGSGAQWPLSGEIDIIEGVNGFARNQMTLHTTGNCAVSTSSHAREAYTGTLATANCDVNDPTQPRNAGCGIVAPEMETIAKEKGACDHATAGEEFNAQNGGVYVTQFDAATGVAIWFHPRGYVPDDILSDSPDPDSKEWPRPLARFPPTGCDYESHFRDLSLVINTALCGDWAGADGVWDAKDGCAAKTGASTCQAYVAQHPEAFRDAYWLINSIKTFVSNGSTVSSTPRKRSAEPAASSLLPSIQLPGSVTAAPTTTFGKRLIGFGNLTAWPENLLHGKIRTKRSEPLEKRTPGFVDFGNLAAVLEHVWHDKLHLKRSPSPFPEAEPGFADLGNLAAVVEDLLHDGKHHSRSVEPAELGKRSLADEWKKFSSWLGDKWKGLRNNTLLGSAMLML
ncbi:hypothetical protein H2203_007596 [Taxawa tesnikishii (nom. ined.)]|nr:hypothetical protein H2203_007596 [Dothideales sp. JES 119]